MNDSEKVEGKITNILVSMARLEEKVCNFIDNITNSIEKSENKLVIELEKMNKIREELGVQRDEFLPQDVFVAEVTNIRKDIRELMQFKNEAVGMASQKSVNFTMIIAIVATIIGILNYVTKLGG